MTAVVYQGEPGAYSEAAAAALVPGARARGLPSFHAAFEAVATGKAERAVVPVENSIGGSVGGAVDALFAFDGIRIVAEHWTPIVHTLLAPEGTALDDVRAVWSHPQALAQCEATLRDLVPQADLVAVTDTAGAARQIAEEQPPGVAAIASRRAGELYGLSVLADHVESDGENVTRFFLIAPEGTEAERGEAMKTSLVLAPKPEVPNALFRSLTAFVGRRIAVGRVEPRPRPGMPGVYRYLVDVDGDAAVDPLASSFADLAALNDEVRVVGSYAVGAIPRRG